MSITATAAQDPHADCYINDHCSAPDCPAARQTRIRDAARAKGQAPEWGTIAEPTHNGRGFDSYWHLDGEHISCGMGLELQAVEWRSDDYGDYLVYLPQGVRVRWEIDHVFDPKAPGRCRKVPVLHGVIGGHGFTSNVDAWMRFRWPAQGGR